MAMGVVAVEEAMTAHDKIYNLDIFSPQTEIPSFPISDEVADLDQTASIQCIPISSDVAEFLH